MFVSINTASVYSGPAGKTSRADIHDTDSMFLGGDKKADWILRITGFAVEDQGVDRYGHRLEYRKRVEVVINSFDFRALVKKAIDEGYFTLPGKEDLLKARNSLTAAIRALKIEDPANSIDDCDDSLQG